MPRKGNGVEIRETSIRISFVDHTGTQRRETLKTNGIPLAPTPANVKYANRLGDQIRQMLRAGSFTDATYAEFFPDSKLAAPNERPEFGKLAGLWLESKGTVTAGSLDKYQSDVRFWKKLLGANTKLDRLTHQVLASTIGKYPWSSAKTYNNRMIALRGVFAMHYRGRTAQDNPLIGIKNRPVVKGIPDPLTPQERDRVIADMKAHYPTQVWAYFQFAFFTGMRPEELIALRWADIDWGEKVVRVQRVRTFKGSERDGTKTHVIRDVDLVGPAIEALKAMKPITFIADGDIFQNPATRAPWHDERQQRNSWWKPSLKRLGIRQRRAYSTRHTYCTAALVAGVPPAYIAAQAGHSIQTLLSTYAKWIKGADGGRAKNLLEQAFNGSAESAEERKVV